MSVFFKQTLRLVALAVIFFASSFFGKAQNLPYNTSAGVSVAKKENRQEKQTAIYTMLEGDENQPTNEVIPDLTKDFICLDQFKTLLSGVPFQVGPPALCGIGKAFYSHTPRYILFHNLKIAQA